VLVNIGDLGLVFFLAESSRMFGIMMMLFLARENEKKII
jgi:hypothetical protein